MVQEDTNEALTERVPVVLAGAGCRGMEASLVDCAGVELGRVGERCDHFTSRKANVHLVCFNGPDDGAALPAFHFARRRTHCWAPGAAVAAGAAGSGPMSPHG